MIINKNQLFSVRRDEKSSFQNFVLQRVDTFANINVYEQYSDYCNDNNIYIIEIKHSMVFKSHNIDELLPNDIYQKLLKKEIILGIMTSDECIKSYVDNIYQYLIVDGQIAESQILLICSTPDYTNYMLNVASIFRKQPIKLEYYPSFLIKIRRSVTTYYGGTTNSILVIPKIKNPLYNSVMQKKFLCLNRNMHIHRTSFLCLLKDLDLINYGHISFLQNMNWEDNIIQCKKKFSSLSDQIDRGSIVKNQLPLTLDYKNIYEQEPLNGYSPILNKYYYDSYFSVVTETLYDNSDFRFITEKTFKTMLYKHPFIMLSTPLILESLRYLGFKTFHPYINEDYDLEMDDNKRLAMVVNETKRLCNLSEIELKSFKENLLEIVEYNYNYLMNSENIVFKLLWNNSNGY